MTDQKKLFPINSHQRIYLIGGIKYDGIVIEETEQFLKILDDRTRSENLIAKSSIRNAERLQQTKIDGVKHEY